MKAFQSYTVRQLPFFQPSAVLIRATKLESFRLIDAIGEDEQHPLAGLMENLGMLIHSYETEHYPIPMASAREVLVFLMEEHHLTQSDLREIGTQGVVSEILNGKRKLNLRQIRLLSQRFQVSPEVFI